MIQTSGEFAGITIRRDKQTLHLSWREAQILVKQITQRIATENRIRRTSGAAPIREP